VGYRTSEREEFFKVPWPQRRSVGRPTQQNEGLAGLVRYESIQLVRKRRGDDVARHEIWHRDPAGLYRTATGELGTCRPYVRPSVRPSDRAEYLVIRTVRRLTSC
jgi:hypothetical protein